VIIVSGTKRSGTSAWMQILRAAGYTVIGDAFPRDWKTTIGDANPHGFWESRLAAGIYFRTNPHPETGEFLFPEQVRSHAVKVFIPGLVRTDLAFIDRVVLTMRPWRAFSASLQRLQAMSQGATDLEDTRREADHVHPAVEWWSENFSAIRDIATRRYPSHVQSFDGLMRDPGRTVSDTLAWLGGGDVEAATSAVDRGVANRLTAESIEAPSDLPAGAVEIFDELYARVDGERELEPAFVDRMNALNEEMKPLYVEGERVFRERMRQGVPRD
jgi:hypothetical protein